MQVKEYRIQGPPGCGKTTWIKRQVGLAAEKYGAQYVSVCSLTRAAASHIANVQVPIPRENIGTLHSLAYRALPGIKIAEAEAEKFNEFCLASGTPLMQLSQEGCQEAKSVDDDIVEVLNAGETTGDRLMHDMNIRRAKMQPVELWPEAVKGFASLWNRFKRERQCADFSDLLEICLKDVERCPANPAALFADESQDFHKLAFSLLRKWGEQCLHFIHVGDPDQILYGWAGVTVDNFYAPLPEGHAKTLEQSYRVPRAVHALAVHWINATPSRKQVVYAPRDAEGQVRRDISATILNPTLAVQDAKRQIDEGKSVMFCVSCSYMLKTIIQQLRAEGIPFHNPYRVARGDWNPLRIGGNSPAARLAAYIAPSLHQRTWTNKEVWRWAEWLSTKDFLIHGARTRLHETAKERPDELADLATLFNSFKEMFRDAILEAQPEWWINALTAEHRAKLAFPQKVLECYGGKALIEHPRAIISTIHAAKGGEADIVYLFPDLSPQGFDEWMKGGAGKEGVRRAFYVGITRARETLVICRAATNMAVKI